jgi:hypothetical protein
MAMYGDFFSPDGWVTGGRGASLLLIVYILTYYKIKYEGIISLHQKAKTY